MPDLAAESEETTEIWALGVAKEVRRYELMNLNASCILSMYGILYISK